MSSSPTATAPSLEPAPVLPISGPREAPPPAPVQEIPRPPRKRAPMVFGGLIALCVVGGGIRYALTYGRESTDDAQVEGHIVNVAARVPGQVTKVLVKDNQLVKEGEMLVELDHEELEAKLAVAKADFASAQAQLASAKAQLALTERTADATVKQAKGGLTQASSTVDSQKAAVASAKADVTAAEARFRLAEVDLDRVKKLRADNAVPVAEFDAKQAAYDQAKAAVEESKARYEATRAGIDVAAGGVTLAEGKLAQADTGPQQVDTARAAVDLAAAHEKQAEAAEHLAELNLSYSYVKASTDGIVSRRTVEVGQLVSPERSLLALVPPKDVWIVANFKEDQIGSMRPGQHAEVEVDTFDGHTFTGTVDSIAGASGARFSLLPPDNASGNYVKVVQRVPVLIRLSDMGDYQLRPGMSAEITVDTRSR